MFGLSGCAVHPRSRKAGGNDFHTMTEEQRIDKVMSQLAILFPGEIRHRLTKFKPLQGVDKTEFLYNLWILTTTGK